MSTFQNLVRRVNNEIKNSKDINVSNLYIDEEKQEIILDFSINPSNKKYLITFDQTYPFTPPKKFLSNGVSYNKILRIPSTRFEETLTKITGLNCPCCLSLMCGHNWKPYYTIDKIVKEFINICKIKQKIIEIIMANAIKEKYLIDDINLNEWIY